MTVRPHSPALRAFPSSYPQRVPLGGAILIASHPRAPVYHHADPAVERAARDNDHTWFRQHKVVRRHNGRGIVRNEGFPLHRERAGLASRAFREALIDRSA